MESLNDALAAGRLYRLVADIQVPASQAINVAITTGERPVVVHGLVLSLEKERSLTIKTHGPSAEISGGTKLDTYPVNYAQAEGVAKPPLADALVGATVGVPGDQVGPTMNLYADDARMGVGIDGAVSVLAPATAYTLVITNDQAQAARGSLIATIAPMRLRHGV